MLAGGRLLHSKKQADTFFDKFYGGIYTVIIQKMDFSIGNIKHYLHPNLARNLY